MDKRTPIPFLRSRPFFQSSWFKPIWVLPARSITPGSVPFSSHRSFDREAECLVKGDALLQIVDSQGGSDSARGIREIVIAVSA
jgi:hypothetical protein